MQRAPGTGRGERLTHKGQRRESGLLLAEVQSHFLEGLLLLFTDLLQLGLLILEPPQLLQGTNRALGVKSPALLRLLVSTSKQSNKQIRML